MIRSFQAEDIDSVIGIWFDENRKTHSFIPESYWKNHFEAVREMLPQAELYVWEENGVIEGFVGLSDGYIEGIFVRSESQSKGIGKRLLNHSKALKESLLLSVYQKNERAIRFYQREGFEIQSEGCDETTGEREFTMFWKR